MAPPSPRLRALLDLSSPCALAATGLALWHGLQLAGGSFAMLPDPWALAPLAALGAGVGFGTGLLLTPLVWAARRLHPRWSAASPAGESPAGESPAGESPAGASQVATTWLTASGLAAGLCAAMLVEVLLQGLPLSGALLGLAYGLPVVAVTLAVMSLPTPPARWLRLVGGVSGLLTPGLILAGLSLTPLPQPAAPGPEPTRGHPDLLLITVDTLRADRLGVYGHPGGLSPALDALAADGSVAMNAVSAAPWTVPSVAAIMTGRGTPSHGAGLVVDPAHPMLRTPLSADAQTLAEQLRAAGYETHALVANAFLSPQLGFDQGFASFDNRLIALGVTSTLMALPLSRAVLREVDPREVSDLTARGLTDAALAWWAAPSERPRFLWVHYIDPHAPYQADPDALSWMSAAELMEPSHALQPHGGVVGERFAAVHEVRAGTLWLTQGDRRLLAERYDAAVAYVDAEVGRLMEGVRAGGKSTIVAVTSDHGEELWEHGGFEHGHAYWRELTWVPLILWGQGVPAGNTIVETVGHVDLAPTLLDLVGVEALPEAEGRALMRLDPAQSVTRVSVGNLYDLPGGVAVEGSMRLMLWADGREAMFNVAEDPREQVNIIEDYPEIAGRLRAELAPQVQATLGAGGEALELDAGMVEGLRSIGYLE